MWKRWTVSLALAAISLGGAPAWAGEPPSPLSAIGEQEDAAIFLEVLDRVLTGDSRGFCAVDVLVVGELVELSEGDTVNVEVVEDDFLGDDVLFQVDFEVTEEEIEDQLIVRSFDCAGALGGDLGANFEIFARAEVVKGECGLFCRYDRPQTSNLIVATDPDDDELEENNTLETASPLGRSTSRDMIARDADWFEFTAPGPSDLSVLVLEYESRRNLDVKLFAEDGALALDLGLVGEIGDAGTILTEERIEAGTYYLRVAPLAPEDFGYYALEVEVAEPAASCTPNATEARACGMCGEQTRTCGADGVWGRFGDCGGEGECAAGAERATDCGMCGQQVEICNAQCEWEGGQECDNQGECERGAVQSQACGEGATQARTCGDDCAWGEFGECRGEECEDGAVQGCYEGPSGTAGVGACREGRQRCEGGLWGACEGQIQPSQEQCEDGRDNDCDGDADDDDDECEAPEPEPEPGCRRDADCPARTPVCDAATGECEPAPEPEPDLGCRSDADCSPRTPICDRSTGICEAEEPGNNGVDGNNGGLDVDPPAAGAASADEGCASAPGAPGGAWPLALALVALAWARRRGR
jgi:MYXO-CTERM domain-containing protein